MALKDVNGTYLLGSPYSRETDWSIERFMMGTSDRVRPIERYKPTVRLTERKHGEAELSESFRYIPRKIWKAEAQIGGRNACRRT
jgi:hypothetical protein